MSLEEKRILKGKLVGDRVLIDRIGSYKDAAELLWSKSFFGSLEKTSVSLSVFEAMYLFEESKLEIEGSKGLFSKSSFALKASRIDRNFVCKYTVFRDLRSKGYSLRSALKYGADFLVYDKGENPSSAHSKWLLFVFKESGRYDWRSWAASNRLAHSVRKKSLISVVDDNGDAVYYEVSWLKP